MMQPRKWKMLMAFNEIKPYLSDAIIKQIHEKVAEVVAFDISDGGWEWMRDFTQFELELRKRQREQILAR
jgi:hypothetical protein